MTHGGAMDNAREPDERGEAPEETSDAVGQPPPEVQGRGATGGMPGSEYEPPPELDPGTGREAGPGTGWGITSANPTGFGQKGQPGTTPSASGGEAPAEPERD